MVIEAAPCSGISGTEPIRSRVAPLGARPLPLSPTTFRSFADHTSTMVSPPSPLIIGSARASMPAIATAASTAFPPCSSTRRPSRVTRGELELAMARPANTGERRCRKAGLVIVVQVIAQAWRQY
jgi:hypothetical protein